MHFVSLNNVVRDICIVSLENSTLSQYARVARAVREGISKVNLHYLPSVKSRLIEIGANYTSPLPADVDVVTKVGILLSDGTLRFLAHNERIRTHEYNKSLEEVLYCDCDEPLESITTPPVDIAAYDGANIFYNCYWGGGVYGELYGASNLPAIPGWRHNTLMGLLEFSTDFLQPGFKVLVEYKSSGSGEDEVIPAQAQTAIEMWALYKLFIKQPGRAQYYMDEFRRHARMLKPSPDALAIVHALVGGQRSSPR